MDYTDLLIEASKEGINVKEKPLQAHDGRIKGKNIAIRNDIHTLAQKKCVLAEELGHYYTTTGNILDQTSTVNIKQERAARLWGYNRVIGLMGIVNAYLAGCRNRYEMAEFLEVTEEFLSEALERYKSKYGCYTVLDNYIIYFEPILAVIEIYGQ